MAGSTTARGYGAEHQAGRRRWAKELKAKGSLPCTRPGCDHFIYHGEAWDLGHLPDRSGWAGVQCVHGNRSDGAKNSNQPKVSSWDW